MGKITEPKKYRYEKDLQHKVGIEIKKRYGFNVWYYHPREGRGGRKAVLDVILCFYGLFVSIELKRDLEERGPTTLQNHNIKLIRRAHGYAFAADTVDGVIFGLEKIYICSGIANRLCLSS